MILERCLCTRTISMTLKEHVSSMISQMHYCRNPQAQSMQKCTFKCVKHHVAPTHLLS